MKDIYKNLISLVKKNNNGKICYVDNKNGIEFPLFDFPLFLLLAIDDEEEFVNECFVKILDRHINEGNLHLIDKLKKKKVTKEKIISILYSSKECKGKGINLNFDKKVKK